VLAVHEKLVFTLPQQIGGLALQNAREIYSILFRAASETLLTIAADPKRLGAAVGFLAVLHTWGQNLHLHPHLHCVVPGGGIGPDGTRWVSCRKSSLLLPRQVLSSRFRNVFLTYLRNAYATNDEFLDDGDSESGRLELNDEPSETGDHDVQRYFVGRLLPLRAFDKRDHTVEKLFSEKWPRYRTHIRATRAVTSACADGLRSERRTDQAS
jgi:hypothetical protein